MTLPVPLPVTTAKPKSIFSAWSRRIGFYCLLILLFSTAYAQSPLYTSNQNQYFLHGLAKAGQGFLGADWLANTGDPTPVFSALVAGTSRLFHFPAIFYGYYALLMGVYLAAAGGIVREIWGIHPSSPAWLPFLAGFIVIQSAGLRFTLSRLFGPNWSYIFEDGVADQRLLGPVFQPSSFGVLLVLSIYLFLTRRPYLAVLAAVVAATFHPTYLLGAGVLVATYLIVDWWEAWRRPPGRTLWHRQLLLPALKLGLFGLASVLPILLYVYFNFGDEPAATTAQAQQILIQFRIPHHALISWWLDATVPVKIGLVAAALVLVRRTRLFLVLLLPTLAALFLTLVQALTGSSTLALLFPWRLSIFLVPLSTTLLLGGGIQALYRKLASRPAVLAWIRRGSLLALALAVGVGAIRFTLDLDRQRQDPARPLLAYVASHLAPGQVFLTPTKLQEFRLATGAPVFVDFKSIPYRDRDVLEWRRRIRIADEFYQAPSCQLLESIASQEEVTHAVLDEGQLDLTCPQFREVFRQGSYAVLQLGE